MKPHAPATRDLRPEASPNVPALEERLQRCEARLLETEHQLQAVRSELQQITGSRLWRSLQWLRRARYWLLYAPAEKRRERFGQLARAVSPKNVLRRLRTGVRGWRQRLQRAANVRSLKRAFANSGDSHGYDVICLPVMPWNSRVQRPQQLMRKFAAHGHRVFYASLGFCAGTIEIVEPAGPNLFETTLPGTPGTNVYQELPSAADVEKMAAAIDHLRVEQRLTTAVVVVQLPFWTALAERLREQFGWPIVYDCMDDHSGFSTNCEAMLQAEKRTIAESDLVVVTADLLYDKVSPRARQTVLVRNACDYDHFAQSLVKSAARRTSGTTIGFYGAVAEWFDADLVADLAELRPDWKFELIGSTHTGDISRLAKLPNVLLLGEQPYADLPRLVAHWDCHIIPFKRIPLTEATNPVKAYEMLATGKPVVAVNLPELRPMARQNLLTLADDASGFAVAIAKALKQDNAAERERRQVFASINTWEARWQDLDRAIRDRFPLASILVVTYNNLPLNKACLQSIFQRTDYPNYELIVVDNASSDGTAAWLDEVAKGEPRLRVILNQDNRGYAAANNQALRAARGQFLCLLNNDTVVTHGWLSTLIRHLQKQLGLGMVGPVSNSVGNEAKIPVDYKTIAAMPEWAEAYCRQHDGETVSLEMLGFFCVVLSREVLDKVGELDERFGLGYFEDDDYCYRVRREGFGLRFARDAFVHHWKEASFGLLGEERYLSLYHENRKKFEAKWDSERKQTEPSMKEVPRTDVAAVVVDDVSAIHV